MVALVYDDLKKIAFNLGAKPGETLSPTVLVNESYERLFGDKDFQNRFQFFSIATRVMRNLFIDLTRGKYAKKRGLQFTKVPLAEVDQATGSTPDIQLAQLADALETLEKVEPLYAKVIELKYFGGFTIKEIGEGMKLAGSTIHAKLKSAETWLNWYLQQQA